MQILGHLCFILLLCSVINFRSKILEFLLGFFLMDCLTCLKHHLNATVDFGFGFLLFGSLGQVFKVFGLFFLFVVGLRLLQVGWYYNGLRKILCDFGGESGGLRKGFCFSKSDLDVKYRSKIASCKCKLLKFSKQSSKPFDNSDETEDNVTSMKDNDDNIDGIFNNGNDVDEEEREFYIEDEEFDVPTLRKMIKTERRRADNAHLELEKERMAAATAAEEAMAMILRLQNEKSLVEMESNQYKRLAEEKQNHDQEVIQSLQWLLSNHESERSVLEGDQLSFFGQKLKLCMQSDEGDHSEEVEDALSPVHIGSLDVNLSP